MQSPNLSHWKVVKRILRYIAGTIEYGLFYTHSENCSLSSYKNNDYKGSLYDHKHTSGYVFHLGAILISLASKKHSIILMSSTEEEYVTTNSVAYQVVWLRRLLKDISNV